MKLQGLTGLFPLWEVATAAVELGLNDLAVAFAQNIKREKDKICKMLDAFVERNAKKAVLHLLPLCGWMRATALHACACLIRLFPDDAKDLADIVTSFL